MKTTSPHVDKACEIPPGLAAELALLLEAELQAGNCIAEVRYGPLRDAVTILLAEPFLTPIQPDSATRRFRRVHIPGWWFAEYTTAIPPHTLACP